MKKKDRNGFALTETLIVSVFVLGVLVYMFVQFSALRQGYDNSFTYNPVPGIYGGYQVKNYLMTQEKAVFGSTISKNVTTNANHFEDLTTCSFTSSPNSNAFCRDLFLQLKIKTVLVVEDNLTNFKEYLKTDTIYSETLKQFLNHLEGNTNSNDFRIVVEYQDGTCASVPMDYL